MRTDLAIGILLVAILVLLPAGALAATENPTGVSPAQNNSTHQNGSVAPGQMLSGVVDVQRAEVRGTVESRAFGLQVARAASENATAEVVAEQLATIERRIDRLEERKRTLERALENESMTEGEYQARIAGVVARTNTTTHLVNQSSTAAAELPTAILTANGINTTAIQTLQTRASELSGPEVAAIAQTIAGPDVGSAARDGAGGPPWERESMPAGHNNDSGGPPVDRPGDSDAADDENETADPGAQDDDGGPPVDPGAAPDEEADPSGSSPPEAPGNGGPATDADNETADAGTDDASAPDAAAANASR